MLVKIVAAVVLLLFAFAGVVGITEQSVLIKSPIS